MLLQALLWLALCSLSLASEVFPGNALVINVGVDGKNKFWPNDVVIRVKDALIFSAESGTNTIIQVASNGSCTSQGFTSKYSLAVPGIGDAATQETWSQIFDKGGTFYFASLESCSLGMVGKVTVMETQVVETPLQFQSTTPSPPIQLPDANIVTVASVQVNRTYVPPTNAVGNNPALANGGLNGADSKLNSASSIKISLLGLFLLVLF